ncbi:DUF3626 domain-containing protein [Tengunoibacter tsumagoiensis]|uniref:DUF3626 domain-containing protein n=1 Tax=Tengunoibacter tsumagoiensis TaxID=2014871 RepID=A0A401ZZI5_9CHLR|nr:DUF3626 domain-containing protein [Tengunoibacter tsumagoiensis]GCE12275.1 hypothetical protein KTT_21340 [Tengunoibacter tsumagoiensis]
MAFQLTSAQQRALDAVYQQAEHTQRNARERIQSVLSSSKSACTIDDLLKAIEQRADLTINFHPDRLLADGRSVITGLYEDGLYRSQFETNISNGGLTAFAGGDRDLWEETMLGGAYQLSGVTITERPKYGGLNLLNYSDGACPRFGSCHFRLKKLILQRATYVFGDSFFNPQDRGVIHAFEPVLAGLLEEIHKHGNALGRKNVDVSTFLNTILSAGNTTTALFPRSQGRALDDYIEAQIHGDLRLAEDVDALVADPSFQHTMTGKLLEATAKKYGLHLEWHEGCELPFEEVPDDFRGPEMPPLARRIQKEYAGDHAYLNAATIGSAAASVVTTPERWNDWGTPEETLQHLKYLWHILVVYGKQKRR